MISRVLFIILFFFAESLFLMAEMDRADERFGSKCGTFLPHNEKIASNRALAKINDNGRPELQKSYASSSGRFLIHYDIIGNNAVNLIDNNRNGIPDYIDSVCFYFNYVHKIEVEELHYLCPASDKGLGGSNAFDVYVLNIGKGNLNQKGLYGYTVAETKLPGGIKNRPRHSAYIVIDNDYSRRDSSYSNAHKKYATFRDTSWLGMKITIAHEYHHAVQFMYGEDAKAPSINEMTSTWFEYRLFPETNDYMQYVEYLFKHPDKYTFGNGVSTSGYLYGIFGQYVYKKFGDNLLRRMWEIIATGVQSYEALNKAFIERETTLAIKWCEFMEWLYYTNERSKPEFGFDHASDFPLMSYYKDVDFTEPSYLSSGWLLSYEFRFYRITLNKGSTKITPASFDVIITNTNIKSAIFQSEYQMPYMLKVVSKPMQDYKSIGRTGYYYIIEQEKGNICEKSISTEGIITQAICYAFPNPFVLSRDNTIYFPAPHDAIYGTNVELLLLNSELQEIYRGQHIVNTRGNKLIIELNSHILNNFGSGIYIFKVASTSSECRGKIAIINSE